MVQAIGELPAQAADGNIYPVLCYYSESGDGPLQSPNVLCQQFHHDFYGYHIFCNMDTNQGELVLLGHERIDDLIFMTYQEISLWWQTSDAHPLCKPITSECKVHDNLYK